jgi:hypothetical protein
VTAAHDEADVAALVDAIVAEAVELASEHRPTGDDPRADR